jgi:hypothetical protein
MALNSGHFSNPMYDKCAYPEDLYESTSPYTYVTNPDSIHNCNGCLTTFGPRGSHLGAGVSSPTGDVIAAAQANIDIDSIMSNRNVKLSKCKNAKVNPVDVLKLKTKNVKTCNDYLDGQHSRMTDPAMLYRGAAINRFYDLHRNPQENIYYDWGVNSVLEAKDNFVPDLPTPLNQNKLLPKKRDNRWKPCSIGLDGNANCGTDCKGGQCKKTSSSRNYKNNILNENKYQGKGVPKY